MSSTGLPDGVQAVRFKPVPAARSEYYAADLIDRYADATKANQHHPVLLVGLFVLDLLIFHLFDDGNSRVARPLANTLLTEAGYGVGRLRVARTAHRRIIRRLLPRVA